METAQQGTTTGVLPSPREFEGGEIPVLDVSNYCKLLLCSSGSSVEPEQRQELEELSKKLRWASENVGFYFLTGAPCVAQALSLLPRMFDVSKQFYSLPAAKARQMDRVKNLMDTYRASLGEPGDAPEVLTQKAKKALKNLTTGGRGTYKTLVLTKGHGRAFRENYMNFPVGKDIPDFEPALEAYLAAVEEVCDLLLPIYERALGMRTSELRARFQDPRHTITLNHYPPPRNGDGVEERDGIPVHADNDFLTVLAQDGVPGLQIMLKDGEWVKAPALEGCLLVNTGEFLTRITNGKWLNTVHKVIQPPEGKHRYSLGCFFYPDKSSMVGPLPQFRSDGELAVFKPLTVSQMLVDTQTTPYVVGFREERTRGSNSAKL